MILEIVIGSQEARTTKNLGICLSIILDNDLGYEFKQDTKRMLQLSNGSNSPSTGFVILFPDGKTLAKDYFGLVQWIENNGLRKI